MDHTKLTMLLTTLQTGSFSKAAAKLHCTQSAITHAMNHLEDELNLKILYRNHNGIKLTPLGEALLPALVAADSALTNLSSEASRLASGQTIPIRIGTFSSISSTWLPDALRAYREQFPYTSFDIRVGTNSVADWLLSGEVDLGLVDSLRSKSFRFYPLMDDPYFAVVSRALVPESIQTMTPEELLEYPFLLAPQNALDKLLPSLPKDRVNVDCDDDSTLLTMVQKRLGITAVPQLCLKNIPEGTAVLPISPPISRTLGIALPNTPTNAASAFAKFLQDYLTKEKK